MGFDGNQWAIVALVFVLGWLLGLLSRGGAGRWRRQARAEEAARIAAEERLATANARIAELERDPPIGGGTAAAIGAAASGRRDDLSLIRGIGREREQRLNEEGVHGYRDLERLTDTDAAAIESRIGVPPGAIAREHWREQAATLRNEGVKAHRTRYL
jgi:predicted flap endonuclease-1-like 5' DNA nuclease